MFHADREERAQIYAGRVALAANDPEQRFFFDLDRRTNPLFLEFNDELSEEERARRRSLVATLSADLSARLDGRFNVGVPTRRVGRDHAEECSRVIRECVPAPLAGPDWDPLGRTFERFAAGRLRRTVDVERDGVVTPHAVTEPDSIFVFLFAELAFASIECAPPVDEEMWTSLLPSLVKMQPYYLARFPRRMRARDYRTASQPLSPEAQREIDLVFPTGGSLSALSERMTGHIRMTLGPWDDAVGAAASTESSASR